MNYDEGMLVHYFRLLRTYGLNHPTSGNASTRDSITYTGCNADEKDIPLVGWKSPFCSQDAPIHSACYKQNGDVGAILHAHSPYTVALDRDCLSLEIGMPGLIVIDAEWETQKADIAAGLFRLGLVLHRGHGVYAAAMTAREAYAMICALEHLAHIEHIRRSL